TMATSASRGAVVPGAPCWRCPSRSSSLAASAVPSTMGILTLGLRIASAWGPGSCSVRVWRWGTSSRRGSAYRSCSTMYPTRGWPRTIRGSRTSVPGSASASNDHGHGRASGIRTAGTGKEGLPIAREQLHTPDNSPLFNLIAALCYISDGIYFTPYLYRSLRSHFSRLRQAYFLLYHMNAACVAYERPIVRHCRKHKTACQNRAITPRRTHVVRHGGDTYNRYLRSLWLLAQVLPHKAAAGVSVTSSAREKKACQYTRS